MGVNSTERPPPASMPRPRGIGSETIAGDVEVDEKEEMYGAVRYTSIYAGSETLHGQLGLELS